MRGRSDQANYGDPAARITSWHTVSGSSDFRFYCRCMWA